MPSAHLDVCSVFTIYAFIFSFPSIDASVNLGSNTTVKIVYAPCSLMVEMQTSVISQCLIVLTIRKYLSKPAWGFSISFSLVSLGIAGTSTNG